MYTVQWMHVCFHNFNIKLQLNVKARCLLLQGMDVQNWESILKEFILVYTVATLRWCMIYFSTPMCGKAGLRTIISLWLRWRYSLPCMQFTCSSLPRWVKGLNTTDGQQLEFYSKFCLLIWVATCQKTHSNRMDMIHTYTNISLQPRNEQHDIEQIVCMCLQLKS